MQGHRLFNVGLGQLASSAGPTSENVENSWWAGATKRRSGPILQVTQPNTAMALRHMELPFRRERDSKETSAVQRRKRLEVGLFRKPYFPSGCVLSEKSRGLHKAQPGFSVQR